MKDKKAEERLYKGEPFHKLTKEELIEALETACSLYEKLQEHIKNWRQYREEWRQTLTRPTTEGSTER